MQWYYSENGSQVGPVSEQELRGKIATGSVKASDLVWREGMGQWQALSATPELAAFLPTSSAGPTPPVLSQPGSPYQPPTAASSYAGAEIPSYLWQSIVVTILCCWPFGIPAIVFAAKVDGLKRTGDLQGARAASDAAKMWCWISFGLGLVATIIFLALGFSGALDA
jgi:hypothetical protein